MAVVRQSLTGKMAREASQSSAGFDWIVVFLSAWWVGGAFLDGWAHNHLARLETFFTQWHAVLYSGFLAFALFMFFTVIRSRMQRYAWLQVMPRGYELSLLGVVIFAVGGVLDTGWHLLFGIEQSTAALLSPTHLMLLLGGVLAMSGPLRAAWQRPKVRREQTLFDLLPAVLSLAYVLVLFMFFTQYADPISEPQANNVYGSVDLGVAGILLQTVIFMGLVLFALRRWRLPLGTFTILSVLNGVLAITQGDLSLLPAVSVASLVTGLLLDLLYAVLKPSVEQKEGLYVFAFLAPAVIQTIYFLMLLTASRIAWTVHLWMGSIVISGAVGVLLSFLIVPVSVPQE